MCLLMDNLEDASAQSLGSSRRSFVISIIRHKVTWLTVAFILVIGGVVIHRWSIARRLFVANLLFVLALTAVVGTAAFIDARDRTL